MFRRLRVSLVLAAAVSLGAGAVVAQDLTVGVKGGVNVADLDIDEDGSDVDQDVDSRTAFVGGLFGQLGLADAWAIRVEGLFSQKGGSGGDDGIDLNLNLDYVEVPVLLALRFANDSQLRPQIFAGPVIAFETTCELEASAGGASATTDCEDDDEDPLLTKSTDVGLTVGAGLEFGGPVLLLIDGRYTFGLTDINDQDGAPESLKNRAWSFMGGVGIRIG